MLLLCLLETLILSNHLMIEAEATKFYVVELVKTSNCLVSWRGISLPLEVTQKMVAIPTKQKQ